MSVDLSPLDKHHDLLIDIPLKVRQGHRFQPTGFPDLGSAEFETREGRSLLVESAQSMANRLEMVCWDEQANDLVEPLRGLSYVRVIDQDGSRLTSSVLEAHRLNSPYIEKSKQVTNASEGAPKKAETTKEIFAKTLEAAAGTSKGRPIDRTKFVQALFKFDVGSLIHGVFLESIDGRLRVARALSAFIEADGVNVVASGGVKNDRVQASKDEGAGRTAKQGFGNLPFPRDEYTADTITLYSSIDLAQIRGYCLSIQAAKLLVLLGLFKLRAFLEGPMRLRTACSFELDTEGLGGSGIVSRNVRGFELPGLDDIKNDINDIIRRGKNSEESERLEFGGVDGVTTVQFAG